LKESLTPFGLVEEPEVKIIAAVFPGTISLFFFFF